ncbi:adenylate/guanylate cyclase domain-containing protein [Flavobacteriaceae bacterium 3-367]
MRPRVKQFFELLLTAIVYWSLAFTFFIFIRYYALDTEAGIVVDATMDVPFTQWMGFGVLLGVLIGFFYGLIEFLFDKFLLKRLNLGLSILLRTQIYLILLIVSMSLMSFVVEEEMDLDLPNERGWWRTSKVFWITVVYFVVSSLVFSFLKIAKERFGRESFLKLLIGKYRKPAEEERVFMFLDLKSSTTIAEKLGHLAYSKFIQECFLDLNLVLDAHSAEVYQYVGDEAVLSWSFKNAVKRNNCVALFFAFQKRLRKRAPHYERTYGHVPEFKAGLHGGRLIVVEVGSVKKELAYHGDVINTSSRIQDQCNVLGEKLLISKDLLENLELSSTYTERHIGNLALKGKASSLDIYALKKA